MARTQTMVQLSDDLVTRLDAEAQRRHTSRSALIRAAITRFLADESEAAVTAAIIEGYRRVPQGIPDGWGGIEGVLDRSAAEVAQRLDAEEREAGYSRW